MAAVSATSPRERRAGALTLPVVEVFGPTVQGEGPDAGRPAYFVRFGGCDYRCAWCDSMHAVEPAEVRANAVHMTVEQIVEALAVLPPGPDLVVISGGNPALLALDALVDTLHERGMMVAVETQGSRWKPWLARVDSLVVSPKPPSSAMATPENVAEFERFMAAAEGTGAQPQLKIVVFDDADLDWAQDVGGRHPGLPLFLSAGTDVGLSDEPTVAAVRERYRWLCESVASRPALRAARVLPQLHVIAWGTAKGV